MASLIAQQTACNSFDEAEANRLGKSVESKHIIIKICTKIFKDLHHVFQVVAAVSIEMQQKRFNIET